MGSIMQWKEWEECQRCCSLSFRHLRELPGPPSAHPPQRDPSPGPLPANPQPRAAEGSDSTPNLLMGTGPGRAPCQPEDSAMRKPIFVPLGMFLGNRKLIIVNSRKKKRFRPCKKKEEKNSFLCPVVVLLISPYRYIEIREMYWLCYDFYTI